MFEPLSKRILLWFSQELKPSQWHSLARLDDITADGVNGFSVPEKVVNLYLNDKNLIGELEKVKLYWSLQYSVNCFDEHSCFMIHNQTLALFHHKVILSTLLFAYKFI